MKPVTILAIESSCDETAASVCVDGKILSNHIANQKVHEQYGGVVPELASRAHMQNIVPVVDVALSAAKTTLADIDAIAFTQAPGLIGSLLVGAQFAKSMAMALNKPLIAVHHMQAHVMANLIDDPKPSFPFLCLTVSGGHTQIVQANSPHDLRVIGETIDDAAGEAFDKSAKILGLPYPGGPLIGQMHQLFQNLVSNGLKFNESPEPVIQVKNISITKKLADELGIDAKKYHAIEVSDNGIGFEQKYADKIFGIFQRLEGNSYQGSGIGLAICKKIADNHKGFITADSALGKGTKFIVVFPIDAATTLPAQSD